MSIKYDKILGVIREEDTGDIAGLSASLYTHEHDGITPGGLINAVNLEFSADDRIVGRANNTISEFVCTSAGRDFLSSSSTESQLLNQINNYNTTYPSYNIGLDTISRENNLRSITYSSGKFNDTGDNQYEILTLRNSTSGNIATELFIGDISGNNIGIFTLKPQQNIMFTLQTSVYNVTDNIGAGFYYRGVVKRNLSNETTLIGNITKEEWKDSGMEECLIDITTNNTYNSLNINISGITDKNLRWVGILQCAEVLFVSA